ncbi:GNAT family N-acetyltransferase [Glaciecola sp. XM2]|uniref:GNAT family N-acetyltransferase n=1 Tax=Glaciecola sp. XM2 TaxID=1914931 RepID=UPI001BDEB269|nr:GNAT family N-acetyltransferase [Glaciecola sp. XM2]MBT1450721.1 GNAT family N-acetyltransferase [Glaciecola sp. XM2]
MTVSAYKPDLNQVKAAYLKAEDLKVAASILYKAYFDDPLFKDIFKVDREGYEARLRAAIREEVSTFWDAQQPLIGLYDEDRLVAVSCMIGPDAAFGAGRFWHWRLKMLLTAGYIGTKQMIVKEEKVRDQIPAQNYYMLSLIGVHTDLQDLGLGHILMSSMIGLLEDDTQSEGIGVLVTLPKCLSFFEDAKFEHVKDIEVGSITGKVMFRPRQV